MLRKMTFLLFSTLLCIFCISNTKAYAASNSDINVIVDSSGITVTNNSHVAHLANITITCYETSTGRLISSSGNSSILSYGRSLTSSISGYTPMYTYRAHVVVYNSTSQYSGVYYSNDYELGV